MSKRRMNKMLKKIGKKSYLLVLIVLVGYYANDYFNQQMQTTSKQEGIELVDCVDGDTANFMIDGEEQKVRFLAIDTPETKHPQKGAELYGKEASVYTCNQLMNAKEIELEYEIENRTDKYGRVLAWIWVDGILLQRELISKGYAKVEYIYGNYKYTDELYGLENHAKEQKLGIWSDAK
ncbi:micrococcal nuclease [Breznakia sp. PF5-3]|uniref:thermonuclease family protein n=1 Tax=unclassified Breznakia TaxID=2623764 RepID=UPI0024068573|nr:MULTISPECIES: thermonuclease family protein [unclassified Breznakia]MDF9825199.1 micrococcal nuclease [Breznakia sp. PM6-1]MDF9836057.1 micrococcal nuclease [Breznakia sp. PF5-3]MDF9838873.1 micrococcal nuclease [Breznakia sp. PFB2-8]MDF9860899.1 micrococcal nuclease [Breznakia sp. PH5-24]